MSQPFDLKTLFSIVSKKLPEAGIDFLLIGGFAVNYYGYARNTLDVDFMVADESEHALCDIMRNAGFSNIEIEENVIFFHHPDTPLRIDFLKVNDNTMTKLLNHAQSITIQGCVLKVPSLRDLLTMKLFSLKNNYMKRMAKDLPDIAYLVVLNNFDIDDLYLLCREYADETLFQTIKDQIKATRQ